MQIMRTDAFRALAEAIANLRPGLFDEHVTVDQIKIVLVEHDIVPAVILDDTAGDERPTRRPPSESEIAELDSTLAEMDEPGSAYRARKQT